MLQKLLKKDNRKIRIDYLDNKTVHNKFERHG